MIYNDISESTYTFKYCDMTFYFSSKFYEEKFINEHLDFLKDESIKLKLRYRCNIYADYMILLALYKKIEKRGFKVDYKGRALDEDYYLYLMIGE